MIEPVVQIDPCVDLQTAVAALIKVAENVAIARWIELPASVLLFLLVPGDPDSGAVYVLTARKEPGTRSTSRTSNSAATA